MFDLASAQAAVILDKRRSRAAPGSIIGLDDAL